MEQFADRLRTLRKERRLNQRTIAARIGISQGHYAKLERSSRAVSREIVDRLAEVYDRSGSDLVRGTNCAVRYAHEIATPQRDELLRDHVAAEDAAARENARACVMYLRIAEQAYRELVALFAAQHEGLLYIETDRALKLFTFLRQYLSNLPNLALLEEDVGEIYLPDAIFEEPVPPECHGEVYMYITQPKLIDSLHRLDAYVAGYELRVSSDILDSVADLQTSSLQPAIDELVAFRKSEESKFFERARSAAEERFGPSPSYREPR
ncbi:MAG TPA: helix-turn-helix transcriptional regulator [Candidatus Cybelea sp.]|jgi:transcriptional regulator with XRE-family HTH domain|nr:helix-turn-helix transcriptional regulator [Candidatus Cybelea sp.]